MTDALRRLFEPLRTGRRAQAAVAIAAVINLIVIVLYVWSSGGQTTSVRVTARGDNAAVAVDGKIQGFGAFAAAEDSGGVSVLFADTYDIPSLPSPRGIDRVRVTDASTGELLFDDDFGDGLDERWADRSPGLTVEDGVVGSHGDGLLAFDADWRDYTVELTLRNVRSAQVVVRGDSSSSGIVATVRPAYWNQGAAKTIALHHGAARDLGLGLDVRLDRGETLKSLVAMVLRPYPWLLLLTIAAIAIVYVLQRFDPRRTLDELAEYRISSRTAIIAVGIAVLGVALFFNTAEREHMPYVPDAVAYIFQAKIFASGHLYVEPPPVGGGVFNFFEPPPIVLTETKWASQYPFGHPLPLAIGEAVGVIWLVPPLLAAGAAILLGLAAARLYNGRVGVLAALLLATSPFFLMNTANFMSHNTAGFYLAAALCCITIGGRRPWLWGALAGLAFGLLFNTRPLTTLALVPAFGVFLLWPMIARETRRYGALKLAAFVAGGLVMLAAYMLYNQAITGDPFRTGYEATGVSFFSAPAGGAPPQDIAGDVRGALGGSDTHSTTVGLQNERVQMALLLLVLHGWPLWVGLSFVLLPFLTGTRRLADWFMAASAVSVMGVWILYEGDGVMWGPRYWYEAMPFLLILAARGADRAASLIADAAHWLQTQHLPDATTTYNLQPTTYARALVYAFVAILMAFSAWTWLLGQDERWRADFVPATAESMAPYFGIDDRIPRLVEEQGIHDALVLVQPCGNFICYGSVFWRNDPQLEGDIVYALDSGDARDETIAAFPGRKVYIARYTNPILIPYEPQ